MSFTAFWRRNLGFFKLAIQQNLEYRLNFFIDAVMQPVISALVEVALWLAVFRAVGGDSLGGYGRDSYIAYALWASFVSRISSNWMYEFRMIDDIETGAINSLVTRPVTFFESYLSQFLGYKAIVIALSFWVPLTTLTLLDLPLHWDRLPAAMLTIIIYVFFAHMISFSVATLAFRLTRVSSFTVAKNLAFWVLSGELLPLDLLPEPFRSILLKLPFCNAVYIPVGYITGRVSFELWLNSLMSLFVGIAVMAVIASFAWRRGMEKYVGTGA